MLGTSLYCELLCFAEQHLCGTRPNDKFQTKIEDIMKIIEEEMEKSKCKYVSHGRGGGGGGEHSWCARVGS